MCHESPQRTKLIITQPERYTARVPRIHRYAGEMERPPPPLYPAEPQLIAGRFGMPHHPCVDRTKWIRDRTAGVRAQARYENLTRAPELALEPRIIQPGEAAMCHTVGREGKAPRAPTLDLRPAQVRQAIPGVADIPGVGFPHEIGDQESRCREAEVGKDGIGVVGEGGVAVVEGQ